MSNDIMNYLDKDRFAAFVGIKLVEVKPGYAIARLEITDDHLNAVNIVQGGVIFTLADFAFAAASNSHGQVSLGINANISYFQPPQGKIITAIAKEVFINKKIASYNVEIFDEDEKIIARFTGMVYRKKDELPID
ncbi:hypothetical protein Desaci_1971 [Desulfosporosinus acidiphilus SJ4]|uniref:Thioesterase domain-containing protein n=1 Tax=Desulfosporosinus acidiphilus (strain DSM 22704 / JCM 16185 / SJ4) TaxID=646529 RepID=I4D574_DESAJ|nr:PaaI family thioesterase [Desulfosporosinus acidiphilus]AFM40948.1 hypothetical protein Desaci_1971 [Desulfosporosinus acidiphilus SJ4]